MKTYHEAMAEAHADYLRQVLIAAQGCVKRAAEMAGLSRSQFYRMLKRNPVATHRVNARPLNRGNSAWQSLGL